MNKPCFCCGLLMGSRQCCILDLWRLFNADSFPNVCGILHMVWQQCRHNIVNKLRWRHNGRDSVSNHLPHDCLRNRLFRRKSKKTSKLRVTGLCAGNSPGTGEFPAQMASNAENVSIWWRHHEIVQIRITNNQHFWHLNLGCPNMQQNFPGTIESMILSSISSDWARMFLIW